VAAGKDAALARVVAAREQLSAETERLEAAGRAAVDIPARIRRSPGKAAAVAAGTAFVVVGGPFRIVRRARRAVFGRKAEMPPSMLPDEVDRVLRSLGSDGDKVRGTLEREFASYLDKTTGERRARSASALAVNAARAFILPIAVAAGRLAAGRLLNPDAPGFAEQLRKIRDRARPARPPETGETPAAAPTGEAPSGETGRMTR
jgi:hypothetical protein